MFAPSCQSRQGFCLVWRFPQRQAVFRVLNQNALKTWGAHVKISVILKSQMLKKSEGIQSKAW